MARQAIKVSNLENRNENTTKQSEARLTRERQLNEGLAHLLAARLKAQVFHWHFTGPSFYGVHKVLEEVYQLLDKRVDAWAERMRALELRTLSSFEEILKSSSSENHQHDKYLMPEQMLPEMNRSLKILAEYLYKIIKELDDEDPATVDLATKILGEVEKKIWMIRSFQDV